MRYVLLKHEKYDDFHIDFLLDCGQERLLAWQIHNQNSISFFRFDELFSNFSKQQSITNHTSRLNCRRIFDHRRNYLDFSGDLGDSRGFVTPIEFGTWELCEVCAKQLVIKTVGTHLSDGSPTAWLWQFEPPTEIALAPGGTPPEQLMQQLPPPSEENWLVSCTWMC
jgi:hypothetical protein